MQFTDEQLKIIKTDINPKLVIAGAGAGKTTTIQGLLRAACRQSSLSKDLNYQVRPDHVIAISFTRDNVAHFQNQLSAELKGVRVITIDKLAVSLLQQYGDQIQQDIVIKADMTDVLASDAIYKYMLQTGTLSVLCQMLNRNQVTWREFYEMIHFKTEDYQIVRDQLYHAFNQYQLQYSKELIYNLSSIYDLLHQIMMKYQPNIQCNLLLVDEAQDLNNGQLQMLIDLFNIYGTKSPTDSQYLRLVLIGDPAQSIFRFNGSNPTKLMEFVQQQQVNYLTLTKNFRSTPKTLELPNKLLLQNFDNLGNMQLQGQRPLTVDAGTEFLMPAPRLAQIPSIVAKIQQLVNQGVEPSRIAILVRSGLFSDYGAGSIADMFKEQLTSAHIPINDYETQQKINEVTQDLKNGLAQIQLMIHAYQTQDADFSLNVADWVEKLTKDSNLPYASSVLYAMLKKNVISIDPTLKHLFKKELHYLQLDMIEKVLSYTPRVIISWSNMMENTIMNILQQMDQITINDKYNSTGVCLTSIHEAKGSEWDYVFIIPENAAYAYLNQTEHGTLTRNLDIELYNQKYHAHVPFLKQAMPDADFLKKYQNMPFVKRWQDQQDCAYVALTRATTRSYIATSKQTRDLIQANSNNRYFLDNIPEETLVYAGYSREIDHDKTYYDDLLLQQTNVFNN